jgi:1-acyl-sn-glycerol-3-phosphate acyltransferase
MIFPEGTRSPDGRLRAFKPGAFQLALDARVPILPIVISGTADALPKHGFVLRGRHQIGIRVLPEVPYASFAGTSFEELTERMHALFARETAAAPDAASLDTSRRRA